MRQSLNGLFFLPFFLLPVMHRVTYIQGTMSPLKVLSVLAALLLGHLSPSLAQDDDAGERVSARWQHRNPCIVSCADQPDRMQKNVSKTIPSALFSWLLDISPDLVLLFLTPYLRSSCYSSLTLLHVHPCSR